VKLRCVEIGSNCDVLGLLIQHGCCTRLLACVDPNDSFDWPEVVLLLGINNMILPRRKPLIPFVV
jgi:hypothetical protein